MFEFKIVQKDKQTKARTGIFNTPHGQLHTPELAIVGTEGVVKAVPKDLLPRLPTQYIVVNTFHIYTKDILPKVQAVGGIHQYLNYPRVTVSDSGGFQVFSLGFGKAHGVGKVGSMFPGADAVTSDTGSSLTIDDTGVSFIFNEKQVILNPEKSMDIQHKIGADMMFAFDECTSPTNSYEYNKISLERTNRWLIRSIAAHKGHEDKQALFAVVQGSYFEDLRKEAARFAGKQDVPGFGIGGNLGKTKPEMLPILEWTLDNLPDEKPRHFLGIGQVWDVFESVERGVDLFDCVIPTREARHRVLYTKKGKVNVRKMKTIETPIEENCLCPACTEKITYRALATMFSLHDPRAYFYATVHNIYFYNTMMKEIRDSIHNGTFKQLKEQYLQYYPM